MSTALPGLDDDTADRSRTGDAPRWVRPFLAIAAVLGLLLVGAAGGMLVGLPDSGSAPVPAADSVDVGFLQDMTVHHHQAVEMASWARDHSTDPEVRQLAFDIETKQTAQAGRMQGWLELWGASAYPVDGHMAWMSDAPGHAHGGAAVEADGVAAMPGMASAEELAAQRAAAGEQADALFLQLMLRHHLGGVGMMGHAAQHAETPEVRNFAAQMLGAQTGESAYLELLLAERGAEPLPL